MANTTGTSGDDHLNGGSGNDMLLGLAGDDRLSGGSGSDTVDGGSGSDIVKGDSGNDILVYRAAENVASTDIYDGGSGIDTLRLMLTLAEWARADVRQDVANYLSFIAGHTLPNGQTNNTEFRFTAFDLRISKTETLEVYVDGVLIDPHDQGVVAVNDVITTSEDSASLSINLLGNDSINDFVQNVVIAQNPALGSVILANDFSNSASPIANAIYTPGVALQSLAVGETATDTFTYTVTDDDGSTSTATVTVTITGSNDGPLITAEAGNSAGTTLAETNAGLSATGTLTASDVDVTDIITANVVAVTHSGPVGGLSNADLLSYFQVTSGALDTTATTSGQLTWNFNSGSQAFDYIAVGETLTLQYTIRPDDGHSSPPIGDGVVTIHITGTNDAPVITSGPGSGSVTENAASVATGTMAAFDPDNGAQKFWTVVGGTAAEEASYQFVMDNFEITKNGNPFLEDTFGNGLPPPDSPNFANGTPTSYIVNGGFQEAGSKLIIDSSDAETVLSVGTSDPFVGNLALVRSNIIPADLAAGLKSDDNFTVEGLFDLIIPDSPRETYGIRLMDRLVGGPGTPPDQLGDDLIELVVRQGQDGVVRVQLRELDIVNDQVVNIGGIVINPPPGADQILLRLTHSTTDVGALHASFDYLAAGVVVGSESLAQIGRIFGTETPGFTGDDENWTRAQIVTYAPAITDSTLAGAYGTLTIDQSGAWAYNLANGQTNVQNLAQGQTAIDTFTVQVTDEHGAIDTETITITVSGSNDAPVMVTGPTGRTLDEDAPLTATGNAFFFDIDLTDTHTVASSLLSATLSDSGSIPADVLTALGSALATTIFDPATGDSDGQLTWDFSLANADAQFLAEGQTLTAVYRIAVQDPFLGTTTQDVTINITGSNDGQAIQRVSVVPNSEANGPSGALGSGLPIIIGDNRYVAFYSDASNLVAGDTNGKGDFFLYDLDLNTTERIPAGINGPSDGAILSASTDGRYFAFNSLSSGLVAGDTNGTSDIFIYDRQTQSYDRVEGTLGQGNGYSTGARISADGDVVAFHSHASNLVAGDTNGRPDTFIYDRVTGAIERVLGNGGVQDDSGAAPTSISSDGQYIAYYSAGTNLVSGDTNGVSDTFVYDRLSQTSERVSISSSGDQGNGNSDYASITPDGRFVAFASEASNLVAGDTNAVRDIFVYDRLNDTTERVSVTSNGTQLNGSSNIPTISDDGRYVAFHSTATNGGNDVNLTEDVFVFDRLTDTLMKLSTTGAGVAGNGQSAMATVSNDGQFVAFDSFASNLVMGDSNGFQDVFLADVSLAGWVLV